MSSVLEKLLSAQESQTEARLLESDLQSWVIALSPHAVFLPTEVFCKRVVPAFHNKTLPPELRSLVPPQTQTLVFALHFGNGAVVLLLADRSYRNLEEVNNLHELCRDDDVSRYRQAAAWFAAATLGGFFRPEQVNPHPHLVHESDAKRCALACLLYTYIRLEFKLCGQTAQRSFAECIGSFEQSTLLPAAQLLRTARQQQQQRENRQLAQQQMQ